MTRAATELSLPSSVKVKVAKCGTTVCFKHVVAHLFPPEVDTTVVSL